MKARRSRRRSSCVSFRFSCCSNWLMIFSVSRTTPCPRDAISEIVGILGQVVTNAASIRTEVTGR